MMILITRNNKWRKFHLEGVLHFCLKGRYPVVVQPSRNEVILDISGKANGRGAYIYMNEEAIQKAKKTNCLGKALECEIPETIYERMSKYLKMK